MVQFTPLIYGVLSILSFVSLATASPHANHLLGRRSHHGKKALHRRCPPRAQRSSEQATPSDTAKEPEAADEPKVAGKTSNSGDKAGSNGDGKPANWPTETQRGATPDATRASDSDPYLTALSKSYNNKGNPLYENKKTGVMTYYGQSLGACGDTYDDQSMTAAVSQILFDAWPGATGSTNLNPICGPFVPGRKKLEVSGVFETASNARGDGKNFAHIGGDGAINCDAVSQCHIPLTATVKHGDKTIIVQIVDRCAGCEEGDIDLTPRAFGELADMALGRTDVEWWFNQY